MKKEQKENFRKGYHKAVKMAAKSEDKTLKDLSKQIGVANSNNLTSMLKNGYPNRLLKAVEPFELLNATIEIKINLSNGQKIILK